MLEVHASAEIGASIDRVWALYADTVGTPAWLPFVEEVLYVSGPLAPGMVYRERTRLAGIRGVQEWRVIELEPPFRRVEVSTDMRMRSLLRIALEARPDGSTVVGQSSRLRSMLPPPFGWLHEAAFAVVARLGIRRAVSSAKRYLEGADAVRDMES